MDYATCAVMTKYLRQRHFHHLIVFVLIILSGIHPTMAA